MQAEEYVLNSELFVLDVRIHLNDVENLFFHYPNRWKVVFLVAKVRELLNNWMVLPDPALDACVLQHKVLNVVAQPFVDNVGFVTPFSVGGRISAISKCDHRECMVSVLPRVLDYYLISIFETEWLIVPIQGMLGYESLFVRL